MKSLKILTLLVFGILSFNTRAEEEYRHGLGLEVGALYGFTYSYKLLPYLEFGAHGAGTKVVAEDYATTEYSAAVGNVGLTALYPIGRFSIRFLGIYPGFSYSKVSGHDGDFDFYAYAPLPSLGLRNQNVEFIVGPAIRLTRVGTDNVYTFTAFNAEIRLLF